MTHATSEQTTALASSRTAQQQVHQQLAQEKKIKERYRSAEARARSQRPTALPPSLKQEIDRTICHVLAQLPYQLQQQQQPQQPISPPLEVHSAPSPLGGATPLAQLSPTAEALLSTMVRSIEQTIADGRHETSLTLELPTSPSLKGSTLKITVDAYNTAPHALNVVLLSNTQTLQFLQSHLPALIEALKVHEEEFVVHRLETALQAEERPSSSDPFLRKVKMDTGNHASA